MPVAVTSNIVAVCQQAPYDVRIKLVELTGKEEGSLYLFFLKSAYDAIRPVSHIVSRKHQSDTLLRRVPADYSAVARVLKRNKTRDLALLKVEGENFPWLELETNRQAYQTGKAVVAIGAPRSIEWSVAQGILSATRDQNGVDTLQTDTAINGGNSGGPLIDLQTGKVIGVNSWMQISNPDVVSLQRGTHGLNFAISAFEVTRTLGISQPINPDTLL